LWLAIAKFGCAQPKVTVDSWNHRSHPSQINNNNISKIMADLRNLSTRDYIAEVFASSSDEEVVDELYDSDDYDNGREEEHPDDDHDVRGSEEVTIDDLRRCGYDAFTPPQHRRLSHRLCCCQQEIDTY